MTKEQKHQEVVALKQILEDNKIIYLADIGEMDAVQSSNLRRACFDSGISIQVIKNTLLRKAMEQIEDKEFEELYGSLKGNTSLMVCETANLPAKMIQNFNKKNKTEKPLFKGAWIEESVYIGVDQLSTLASLKSKEELIGEIVTLLQSPAKNVISALSSGGSTLAGIVKTLQERPE
ncbi:MAG: 50S ribosomal protein L10 [Flavobacteriales bacterium]|nr:50S ribosomal protein L10 [Flavobacteriales bacterium]